MNYLRRSRRGFSLVELAVVVIIIGVLAAFGVPRFRDSVERSKAAEAVSFLAAIRSAQERYQARKGIYASKLGELDIAMQPPKYFLSSAGAPVDSTYTIGESHANAGNPEWSVTLQRDGNTSSYGNYTVIFTQLGISSTSVIVSNTDLNARINPLAN